MLPIVAISNLVTAVVALGITILIARSYKKQPDPLKKDFLLFFVLLTLYFFTIAVPGLLTHSGIIAGIVVRIAIAFLLLAVASFLAIPVSLFGYREFAAFLLPSASILALALLILDAIYFMPSEGVAIGDMFYFSTRQIATVRIVSGVISLSAAFLGSFFFISFSHKIENVQARLRARLLGYGMLILAAAAILNYIVFTISPSFISLISASIVALSGILVVGMSILLIKPRETD